MTLSPTTFHSKQSLYFPGDIQASLNYAAQHLCDHLSHCLRKQASCHIALSGGSTPLKLFKLLSEKQEQYPLDWSRIKVFWGDERFVRPEHPDSNYGQAMKAGLKALSLQAVFPMPTLTTPAEEARRYEELLLKELPKGCFDYVMLGLGEDGHTASLFPHDKVLEEKGKWVCSTYSSSKEQYRLSLTLPLLNQAKTLCFYVFGSSKQGIVKTLFEREFIPSPQYPATMIDSPSYWIIDQEAAASLLPLQ